ncbi:OLC1v1027059C1 [Oldenlandia corymbosa var. corymbosa]|uniref:OLC1v1027059C1 n=1 Tax=Oldenlandia corymbosa var. corymbosa TaxID=529605 RepID=A0AAV1C9T0_OLDCO|nr:OLC1v1027059C1 [Oldenlandia corymbosa var. corymbosa]
MKLGGMSNWLMVMLWLVLSGRIQIQETEAIECDITQMKPCWEGFKTGTVLCCFRIGAYISCFCDFAKDPRDGYHFQDPNAKVAVAACLRVKRTT